MHMEDPIIFSSPKQTRTGAAGRSFNGGKPWKGGRLQPFKPQTVQGAQGTKPGISVAQALPLTTTENLQNHLTTPAVKVKKSSQTFRLHTEERAARRAGFNHLVASKIGSFEILRRFEEKIQKVVEEEEIKIMRKEMVPKAQLMPIFDRPFLPQRSGRAPTVPKEPKFHFVNKYYRASQN